MHYFNLMIKNIKLNNPSKTFNVINIGLYN